MDPLTDPDAAASTRKGFLTTGAAVSVTLALGGCGSDDEGSGDGDSDAGTQTTTTPAKQGGDIDIVNYALLLEYLEADFYDQVVAAGVLEGQALEYAKQFGSNEQEHVDALTATVESLGGTPAPRPKTRFGLENPDEVLQTALDVENLGAAAYLGQAARIKDKQILAAALSIHAVEARHAGALQQLLGRKVSPDGALAKPADMDAVLAAVKPFIVS